MQSLWIFFGISGLAKDMMKMAGVLLSLFGTEWLRNSSPTRG